MHRVYSPAKDKWFQYEDANRAEAVAKAVAQAQAVNMALNDDGDWEPPKPKADKRKKR
jgi:hypothetical protein